MSLGPFFSGQTPAEPALISVTTPEGGPRDLTPYTAEGKLYAPNGTDVSSGSATTITEPLEGLVQFDWPVPSAFSDAGIYLLQLELTTADEDTLDFTSVITVEVEPAPPPTTDDLIVTTDQVYAMTNRIVSTDEIRTAQYDISIFLGVDLGEAFDTMSEQAVYWTSIAVAHQAGYEPSGFTIPGASRVKTGDAEVQFSGSSSVEDIVLAPMAKLALSRVTTNTIYATPFLGDPLRTPIRPMWVTTTV